MNKIVFNYLVTKDYVASGQRQLNKVNWFLMYDIYIYYIYIAAMRTCM